jgi:hypothetical protein
MGPALGFGPKADLNRPNEVVWASKPTLDKDKAKTILAGQDRFGFEGFWEG